MKDFMLQNISKLQKGPTTASPLCIIYSDLLFHELDIFCCSRGIGKPYQV
jgi:hypothetical protein